MAVPPSCSAREEQQNDKAEAAVSLFWLFLFLLFLVLAYNQDNQGKRAGRGHEP